MQNNFVLTLLKTQSVTDKHSYNCLFKVGSDLHQAPVSLEPGVIKVCLSFALLKTQKSLQFLPPLTSHSAPNVATRAANHLPFSERSGRYESGDIPLSVTWEKKRKTSIRNKQPARLHCCIGSLLPDHQCGTVPAWACIYLWVQLPINAQSHCRSVRNVQNSWLIFSVYRVMNL